MTDKHAFQIKDLETELFIDNSRSLLYVFVNRPMQRNQENTAITSWKEDMRCITITIERR